MKVIESVKEMQNISLDIKKSGKSIGFVPTMGALHEGHISLVKTAHNENDIIITSIFVNPTQFGPNEDFSKYPRTFESDSRMLENEGNSFLFFPSAAEMYPLGYETFVEETSLPNHLCGITRPGHFKGVTTVVLKLFNITMPDSAYFGQKDYQQSIIIKKMVCDLNINVNIRVLPIIREMDGLAMSSRNKYLSPEERASASVLYKSIKSAKTLFSGGERNAKTISENIIRIVTNEAPMSRFDYVRIVDPASLEERQSVRKGDVITLAVYFGKTRLIDNCIL